MTGTHLKFVTSTNWNLLQVHGSFQPCPSHYQPQLNLATLRPCSGPVDKRHMSDKVCPPVNCIEPKIYNVYSFYMHIPFIWMVADVLIQACVDM